MKKIRKSKKTTIDLKNLLRTLASDKEAVTPILNRHGWNPTPMLHVLKENKFLKTHIGEDGVKNTWIKTDDLMKMVDENIFVESDLQYLLNSYNQQAYIYNQNPKEYNKQHETFVHSVTSSELEKKVEKAGEHLVRVENLDHIIQELSDIKQQNVEMNKCLTALLSNLGVKVE